MREEEGPAFLARSIQPKVINEQRDFLASSFLQMFQWHKRYRNSLIKSEVEHVGHDFKNSLLVFAWEVVHDQMSHQLPNQNKFGYLLQREYAERKKTFQLNFHHFA